jgi:CHAT domain-containing protein
MAKTRFWGAVFIEMLLWLGMGSNHSFQGHPLVAASRARLMASLQGLRFAEARFYGQMKFSHLPLTEQGKSCPEPSAMRKIRNALARTHGKLSIADQAVLRICDDVSGAINALEHESQSTLSDVGVLTDLSAAYLIRAAKEHDPLDFLRALKVIDKALSIEPNMEEAKFNKAIALEKLFLQTEAVAAWRSYLSQSPNSSWSAEALLHLRLVMLPADADLWREERLLLESRATTKNSPEIKGIVIRFRQAARQYAENDLLAGWANAFLERRNNDSERALVVAYAIGSALYDEGGDSMALEEVMLIRELIRKDNMSALRKIAAAHIAFRLGMDLYHRDRFLDAGQSFKKASISFYLAGSPMALWAELFLAICHYYDFHYRSEFEELSGISRRIPERKYPSLRGRILWMMGLTHFARANLRESLAYFQRALSVFETLGEKENIAGIQFLLAQNYFYSGEIKSSWVHRYLALQLRGVSLDLQRDVNIFYDCADASLSAGFWGGARYFYDEQLRLAQRLGLPSNIVEAYLRRSRIFSLLNDIEGARSDLLNASIWVSRIEEPSMRYRLLADIWLSTAEVKKSTSPVEAIKDLSKALEYFQGTGLGLDVSQILLARYKLYLALGDKGSAGRDLLTAVHEERERLRRTLQGSSIGPADAHVAEVYDEAISFEARLRGNAERALNYAEEVRARAVIDTANLSSASERQESVIRSIEAQYGAKPAEDIQKSLPKATYLIEYKILGNDVVAWVVNQKAISFYELRPKLIPLSGEIRQFRSDLLHESTPISSQRGGNLYKELVAPLIKELPEGSRIIFIPDGPLQLLPFSALWDAGRSRYLVERFDISLAPSASLYAICLQRPLLDDPGILTIGVREIDRDRQPWLPMLKAAEEEARDIASLYPRSTVLVGADANLKRIANAMGKFSVVHFSGHSVLNPEFPLESRLLLAKRNGAEVNEISAADLYGHYLVNTRLVVLSSCSSAGSEAQASEGLTGLSRAFIVNGASAVVGSLWNIDDKYAATLFKKFHVTFLKQIDAMKALCVLQRSLIRGPNRELGKPKVWASLELVGGTGLRQ